MYDNLIIELSDGTQISIDDYEKVHFWFSKDTAEPCCGQDIETTTSFKFTKIQEEYDKLIEERKDIEFLKERLEVKLERQFTKKITELEKDKESLKADINSLVKTIKELNKD